MSNDIENESTKQGKRGSIEHYGGNGSVKWWFSQEVYMKIQMQRRFSFFSCAFVIIAIAAMSISVYAQSDEVEVRAVIDRLFDGMRAGDSTMVRSVLHEEALMARAGSQGLRIGPMDGFVRAVGTPYEEIWDERIWDVDISIDGRLASAWMEFAFFLGDTLSHCGVNSMQLYQTDDGWKIIYLADTNRAPTCEVPEQEP